MRRPQRRAWASRQHPVQRFFARTGGSPTTLAQHLGCSTSTITRYLRGEREPSFKMATAIAVSSDGAFTAIEFIDACLSAWRSRAAAVGEAA